MHPNNANPFHAFLTVLETMPSYASSYAIGSDAPDGTILFVLIYVSYRSSPAETPRLGKQPWRVLRSK